MVMMSHTELTEIKYIREITVMMSHLEWMGIRYILALIGIMYRIGSTGKIVLKQ